MQILVAPNAFKNSLDASDAAIAIERGFRGSRLQCGTRLFPVGDGGDGTGALIVRHCKGDTRTTDVRDPLGRAISSSFGLIDGGTTAVIELADASGLRLLDNAELNPLEASSYGTGELMLAALRTGVRKMILCIGGSATVDGGLGILRALGFRFLDNNGNSIEKSYQLRALDRVDSTAVETSVYKCGIDILCDVENPLLGKEGAAPVFGPQKGASGDDVKKLELALSRFSEVTLAQTGNNIATLKHGGAAGGVAAGLAGWLNAKLVNGIDHFLSLTGFEEALRNVQLVITGEGSIDEQTLQGKGPYGVARLAKQKGIPVIGLAGKIPLATSEKLEEYFDVLLGINNELAPLPEALKNTSSNLERTARNLGNMLAFGHAG